MAATTMSKETIAHTKLGGSQTLGDADLTGCTFKGGTLAQYEDPAFGLRVHDVTLRDCRTAPFVLHGIEFRNIAVDRLTCGARLTPRACVFQHVTLSGAMPDLMLMPAHSSLSAEVQEAFAAGAEHYYKDVDWALDISQGTFKDAEFSGVPGHLVKRDPATQFLLHRSSAEHADTEGLSDRARSYLAKARKHRFDSIVIVAPTRSKYFDAVLADLEDLRTRGLAE
ncbi:hypothetical protein BIV57_02070 [Mangrovactinospora gilvigrisea]|uniref:Pentapeptide repeat-containing protein n=1 Tax=Mangrovactinospora gilvigrisea TaxID=1428644 RepID=A0A1J7CCA0_9ACTN|nr:hypothetical protein [Mangrovactinospora gilvigrisea]OIV39140.1 hypothetical protein BIV57_02070 [Mangrovactinospora gilvigrisea]